MSYIVKYYIEVRNSEDQNKLEQTLNDYEFSFYDATHTETIPPTLEDIEIILEAK